ncbi:hypothetical protein C1M53_31380 [Mesorhizobium sp. Pch-S]|nr:hypothetical protein C1M53_31380 [Mesorhizobium sp. Pch-S]
MAYVGTPRSRGSELDTLASILQGEAGGEGLRGLQAVASVIQNRANQNFSGYGSSLLDQALARNQFQGQSSRVGREARTVAEQLLGGRLPDVTGGALYYANPGDSTASWARRLNEGNALKIGNHYFTDNAKGEPFSNPYAGMADGPKGQEAYPQAAPALPPPRMIADRPIAEPQTQTAQGSPPSGLLSLLGGDGEESQGGGNSLMNALMAMQPQDAPQAPPMPQQPQGPTLADLVSQFMQSRKIG